MRDDADSRPVGDPAGESSSAGLGPARPARTVTEWGPHRTEDLAALVADHRPDEELSAEELAAVLWQGPEDGAVLGLDDGDDRPVGAVAVAVGEDGHGSILLLVVERDGCGAGTGRDLLHAAETWLAARGAHTVTVGGPPGRTLWPGVPDDAEALVGLLTSAGYDVAHRHRHLRVDTTFRADEPAGVTVVRAVHEPVQAALAAFVADSHPAVLEQVARATVNGCCHVALAVGDDGATAVVGFACHSVNRAGWIGPLAVAEPARRRGIGTALLGRVCRDLWAAEYEQVEITAVGEPGFFTAAAAATDGRGFVVLHRRLTGN